LDARAKRARPFFSRKVQRTFRDAKLKPKQALDLGPHGEAEDDEHEDEQRQRERETQACELSGAAALDSKPPLRTVEAVRRPDRLTRVQRRRVCGLGFVRVDLCFGPRHVAEV
jgi:hypothetical protein